jgi:hypothetical protein
MEKLIRFSILSLTYLTLLILFYCAIPTVSWIFGGEFLSVAQHPMHVLFVGVLLIVMLGVIFSECFDSNFRSKKS